LSLREDIEIMKRHKENGTLAKWLQGDVAPLNQKPWPRDETASVSINSTAIERLRGD
jgi:hypothetical protein|tara:strand:- start:601 stop:771 length:171 start_codon:yes stop_codon:yes gene_type:complete